MIAELDNIEEIVVNTLDVTANDGGGLNQGPSGGDTIQVIGNFSSTSLNYSTITVEGSDGDDTVDITSLQSAHRIVFRSNGGNDTIVGTLRPQDVIVLPDGSQPGDYTSTDNGNGTTTLSNGTHSITYANSGTPEIVAGEDAIPGGHGPGRDDDDRPQGSFDYTQRDLDGLKKLINGRRPFADDDDADHALGARTISGAENNGGNGSWGASDTPFIRLTEARYGEYDAATNNRDLNPIFDGLDPRAISNILGAQEEGLAKSAKNASIFFMAFGQYFDHGLDFIPKNATNGTIEIGGPGTGRPGSDNPADLTRGEVHGFDENGIPLHLNKTTAFVDQNQAYGSHNLVAQFLRQGDGNGELTSYLLKGAPDPSSPSMALLPTLREAIQHHWDNNTVFTDPSLPNGSISFRDYYTNYPISEGLTGSLIDAEGGFDPQVYAKLAGNFMNSGHALLLDTNPFVNLLDHYVAGDGRANENYALTSMHTIWARNHNYHVEQLKAAGFQGTEKELFEAAKAVNEAEYQRVVFDEFAGMLLGGIRGRGDHGHGGYNPDADPGISHEFAAAVYRFGHSLIGQTLTVLDENGNPKQVALFDAFLNPTNDAEAFPQALPPGYTPQPGYEQLGVDSILGGIITQPAEEVDFNIVDAVRNDLVRIHADLFSFNLARGRDVGLGTLNQVRMDLVASQNSYVKEAVGYAGNLSAYASWEDFQARNGLSDAVIAQFKQAYLDLVLDTPEKIAAFVAVNPDIQLLDGENGAKIVKGIDRVDLWVGGLAEKHINGGMVGQTFWVVLHEQFDRLQEADRFYYKDRLEAFDFYEAFIDGQEFADIVARNNGLTNLPEHIFKVHDEDGGIGGSDGDDDVIGGNDDDDIAEPGDDDDDDDVGSGDDDDDDVGSGDDDASCGDGDGTGTPAPQPGSSAGGTIVGTNGHDVLVATARGGTILALDGNDSVIGGDGADVIHGGGGNDFLSGEGGRDIIFGGDGNDDILGGDGADMLYGDAGHDRIFGGDGNDLIDAGWGNDTVYGGAGDDVFVAAVGDGNDTYYGDDLDGGTGIDTLDMAAITAAITADLGTGFLGRGTVTSAQTGSDTLWGIENIVTGSGDDVITASRAVNVIDGGAGNDTFRFLSAADADGDTILGFQPGDRIDLSAIDANGCAAGKQSFTLVNGAASGPAQLAITHESRADGDYTVVSGNTGGPDAAEFRISIKGNHDLQTSDFVLS